MQVMSTEDQMLLVMVIFQVLIKLILQQIPLQEYPVQTHQHLPVGELEWVQHILHQHHILPGGRPKDQGNYSTVEKLTYTSETMKLTSFWIKFIYGRQRLAGTSSPSAGYFGGGQEPSGSPSKANRMDKMTFSTDSTSAIPGGNLSSRRESLAIQEILLTVTLVVVKTHPNIQRWINLHILMILPQWYTGAALSVARMALGAIGNDTHGYFGNGNPGPNGQVSDKLTYSTDTSATVPALAGPGERSYYTTAGNISQGYFIGGYYPTQSTVFKLTYATDLSMSAPGAFLPVAKHDLTGSSSRMDGAGSSNIV